MFTINSSIHVNILCLHVYVDLIIIKENQALRYINLMIYECWEVLKKLGKVTKSPLHAQNIFTLIDKDLLAITTYIQNKVTNEVSKM